METSDKEKYEIRIGDKRFIKAGDFLLTYHKDFICNTCYCKLGDEVATHCNFCKEVGAQSKEALREIKEQTETSFYADPGGIFSTRWEPNIPAILRKHKIVIK